MVRIFAYMNLHTSKPQKTMDFMSFNEWIIGRHTGISSRTMWAAITGAVTEGEKGTVNWDVPHDPDDFSRCIRFVRSCNVTAEQLQKVKEVFPWYAPQIDNWDELVLLWDEENPSGLCPRLYDRLQQLEEQSYILAGYKSNGKGMWTWAKDLNA